MIMYGMGAKLMASILGVSIDECKEILNEFYTMFPAVKEFTISNEVQAKERGFVEDYIGRRRHLPDALLEELEIRAKKNIITEANLFMDCTLEDSKIEIPDEDASKIWRQKWEDYRNTPTRGKNSFDIKQQFKDIAKENCIDIFDNGAFISRAMTQCTNARIQGSAATLTKKAMVTIFNDPIMHELGFRLLIPVHDELLGECPVENVQEVEKRLSELMIAAAKPECSVNMKVDTYAVKHWYADEVYNSVHDKYLHLIKAGENANDAFIKVRSDYPELSEEIIKSMCEGTYDTLCDAL